jgi:hypothetical protein
MALSFSYHSGEKDIRGDFNGGRLIRQALDAV